MTEKSPKKRPPALHFSSAHKAEAIALWKAGTHTVDELAKKFKRNRRTMYRLFKDAGAEKGSTAAETAKKVEEAVTAAIVDDATVLANRIRETKEDHYKIAKAITNLGYSLVRKAVQNNQPIGSLASDAKALREFAATFKIMREEKYAVLGINASDDNDDKPLPSLVIQELSSDDIKRLHEQSLMADDELGGMAIEPMGDEDLVADERVETE